MTALPVFTSALPPVALLAMASHRQAVPIAVQAGERLAVIAFSSSTELELESSVIDAGRRVHRAAFFHVGHHRPPRFDLL
jgi:hypothetical protein